MKQSTSAYTQVCIIKNTNPPEFAQIMVNSITVQGEYSTRDMRIIVRAAGPTFVTRLDLQQAFRHTWTKAQRADRTLHLEFRSGNSNLRFCIMKAGMSISVNKGWQYRSVKGAEDYATPLVYRWHHSV